MKHSVGIIAAMALKHLFIKPATIAYPKGELNVVRNYRGKLEYDPTNCINCTLCERDCPTGAIKIINEGTKEDKKMKAILDVGHCIFCGQCVDICPKKCLSLSKKIDLATLSKDDLTGQL